jgi:hypothetical protein
MKGVSFDDPSQALAAAIWMESFFDSDRYQALSRHVAATLLPEVTNVAGFDAVFDDLVDHTNKDNQIDIISIGQTLSHKQWNRFERRPVDPAELPYVQKEALPGDYYTAAWELDTVSHGLWEIWVDNNKKIADKDKKVVPRGQYLESIILENNAFSTDFTGANLTNGVLANVSFQGAILTAARLVKVIILSDVDLSGVTQFDQSDWTNTHWWKAQKISTELCKYLEVNYAPPKNTTLPSGCQP